MFTLAGAPRRAGGGRRRRRARDRDRARHRRARPRHAARPGRDQPPDDAERAAAADAELQLAQIRTAAGAPPFQAINVAVPDFVKALDRADRVDAARRHQGLSALAAAARRRPSSCRRRSPTPTSTSSARTLAGQQEQQPRWRRCVDRDRRSGSAKRSARRSSRKRSARRRRPTRCRWCRTSRARCGRTSTRRPG